MDGHERGGLHQYMPDLHETMSLTDIEEAHNTNLLNGIDKLQSILVEEELARREVAKQLEEQQQLVERQMSELKAGTQRLQECDDQLGYLQHQIEQQMYRKASLVEALRIQRDEARKLAAELDELEPQLMSRSLAAADLLMEAQQYLGSGIKRIPGAASSTWLRRSWSKAKQAQKVA